MSTSELLCGQALVVTAFATRFVLGRMWAAVGGENDSREPKRKRKMLLHRREIARLSGAVNRKGMALVPLAIYFNKRGLAKVQLALAEGKRQYDKRQSEKAKDWDRQKARLLRDKG